ncbi:lytic transglycosylase domain-containing protein [Paenibacillus bouchesdurhonensis]|uniref:lytic transglycosylase domain-containing protein n=1 Tax=Paenibacillus bouchesdurhonensis TaxID=1870990 RepID=UPI000DA605D8|nr:lytic transglycosylase domain-containing protein [Paenibacillus bouchesdurhonensis]
MEIDTRTMGQLIQLQMMNDIDLQGTSVQRTTSGGEDSLFDILLQELMTAEGQEKTMTQDGMLNAGQMLSGSMDNALWYILGQQMYSETEIASIPVEGSYSTAGMSMATGAGLGIDELVSRASRAYGVAESLIKAVIETESSFNANAVSSAGAKGLMQLMDGTARGLGVSNPFDPAQNIDGGTRYLSSQLKRFGGEEKTALAAYNAGPGRIQRLGISNDLELMEKLHLLPKETQNYITKIDNARLKYEI